MHKINLVFLGSLDLWVSLYPSFDSVCLLWFLDAVDLWCWDLNWLEFLLYTCFHGLHCFLDLQFFYGLCISSLYWNICIYRILPFICIFLQANSIILNKWQMSSDLSIFQFQVEFWGVLEGKDCWVSLLKMNVKR